MTSITIDTLKFARRLRDAGVSERQAEAEACALAELFAEQRDDLVTRESLRAELEPVRTDLHPIKWILALMVLVNVVPALKALFG
ncbi:DUF1640 domain-containing protein [Endothiovibrio diazotrophicus]